MPISDLIENLKKLDPESRLRIHFDTFDANGRIVSSYATEDCVFAEASIGDERAKFHMEVCGPHSKQEPKKKHHVFPICQCDGRRDMIGIERGELVSICETCGGAKKYFKDGKKCFNDDKPANDSSPTQKNDSSHANNSSTESEDRSPCPVLRVALTNSSSVIEIDTTLSCDNILCWQVILLSGKPNETIGYHLDLGRLISMLCSLGFIGEHEQKRWTSSLWLGLLADYHRLSATANVNISLPKPPAARLMPTG